MRTQVADGLHRLRAEEAVAGASDGAKRASLADGKRPIFKPQDGARSLRDLVYDQIRDAILDGSLAPGQRIKERDVATQMRVSTTPIKEALRRLEQEGLILSLPRRGASVSSLSLTRVSEIIQVRAAVEGIGAGLAAEKMSPTQIESLGALVEQLADLTSPIRNIKALNEANQQFHAAILAGADNYFVTRFVTSLRPFDRSRTLPEMASIDQNLIDFHEHRAIFEALANHDPGAAESLMRAHLVRALTTAVDWARERARTHEGFDTTARPPRQPAARSGRRSPSRGSSSRSLR